MWALDLITYFLQCPLLSHIFRFSFNITVCLYYKIYVCVFGKINIFVIRYSLSRPSQYSQNFSGLYYVIKLYQHVISIVEEFFTTFLLIKVKSKFVKSLFYQILHTKTQFFHIFVIFRPARNSFNILFLHFIAGIVKLLKLRPLRVNLFAFFFIIF